MAFRPIGDSILVQMDEESDKVAGGLLFKPDAATEHIFTKAVVLAVGPGKWSKNGDREPVQLEPGMGVIFIKYLAKTHTGEYVQYALGENQAILKPSDVILAYDRANDVEIGHCD